MYVVSGRRGGDEGSFHENVAYVIQTCSFIIKKADSVGVLDVIIGCDTLNLWNNRAKKSNQHLRDIRPTLNTAVGL